MNKRRIILHPLALLHLILMVGCVGNFNGGKSSSQSAGADGVAAVPASKLCSDVRFGQQLWAPLMSNTCYGCHITGGLAQSRNARFVLTPTTQPDYLAKNLAMAREMAAIKVDGQPLLLQKPTGAVSHGGGVIINPNSAAAQSILQFIAQDDASADCLPRLSAPVENLVTFASNSTILRQAALVLAGRLPNPNEIQMASSGQMTQALDSLIKDPNFDATVTRVYNDVFLTNSQLGDNAPKLRWDQTYNAVHWYDDNVSNGLTLDVTTSYGQVRNPLQTVAYVIRQDRPFTEILTGNYLLVNPLGACSVLGAGHNLPFSNACSTDPTVPVNTCQLDKMNFNGDADACKEYLPAVPNQSGAASVCGVLSDLTLLHVVNTTPTNRNRHRAAFIMTNFLDLDPMTLGPQLSPGSGATTTTTDPNFPPTLIEPQCIVCHQIVDGIGSSLRNWSDDPHFVAVSQPNDIFPTALYGVAMPPDSPEEPLCWMAGKIAADPGFARATVKLWFTAITGQQVLVDPAGNDPNYAILLGMKLSQNDFIEQIAEQFAADNFNLRHMIEAIIMSPYFRASGIASSQTPADALEASMFGHGQRVGPEQLDRVIHSVVASSWNAPSGQAYLLKDYLAPYGGIDQFEATRNQDMSGVMAAIANLMATNVSCQSVTNEFSNPASSRQVFPYVEATTVPDNGAQTTLIKQNIQHMYSLFLGEQLDINSQEMGQAYDMFNAVYLSHANDSSTTVQCSNGSQASDPKHTLNAWMVLQSSLLTDMEFLYE